MKVLTTEQQQDLLNMLTKFKDYSNVNMGYSTEDVSQLNYWVIELKPKRTRKPKVITDGLTSLDAIQV